MHYSQEMTKKKFIYFNALDILVTVSCGKTEQRSGMLSL